MQEFYSCGSCARAKALTLSGNKIVRRSYKIYTKK